MAQAILSPQDCCSPCESPITTTVPGPTGADGAACVPCEDGSNSFTTLTAGFTMPSELSDVTITVGSTEFMVPRQGTVPGQIINIEFAGDMEVRSITSSTQAVVRNIMDTASSLYLDNAPPTTAIPISSRVAPSGQQGPTGSGASAGAPTSATYITQTPHAGLSAEQNLSALLTGYMKSAFTTGVVTTQQVPIPITDGGTGGTTAVLARGTMAVAPNNATFITQTASGELTNEQDLASLVSGYLKVTTATGVLSSQPAPIPATDLALTPITTVTTSTVLNTTHFTVLVDATLGAVTITLPTVVGITGKIYTIKQIDTTLNTVTIACNGSEKIDGVYPSVPGVPNTAIRLQGNGIGWYTI